MSSFFKKYFQGKAGQRDFTEADLPETRIQLFWQAFNTNRGHMVGLNLLYLLVWLPAILWTFLNGMQLMSLSEVSVEALRSLMFTWLLVLSPLIAITGPFNAGISLVMHRWAQDEHSFPYSDFRAGMKENWKQALPFGLIDGIVPLVLFLCVDYYWRMSRLSALFLIPLAVTGFAAFVWFLSAPLVPALIVSYRQSFPGILRNAVLMTLAQLPRAVAVRLGTLIVPIALALGYLIFPGALNWLFPIAAVLYTVMLLAFNKLLWASFANFLGEKYLNPNIPGARTNIGLRQREAEK